MLRRRPRRNVCGGRKGEAGLGGLGTRRATAGETGSGENAAGNGLKMRAVTGTGTIARAKEGQRTRRPHTTVVDVRARITERTMSATEVVDVGDQENEASPAIDIDHMRRMRKTNGDIDDGERVIVTHTDILDDPQAGTGSATIETRSLRTRVGHAEAAVAGESVLHRWREQRISHPQQGRTKRRTVGLPRPHPLMSRIVQLDNHAAGRHRHRAMTTICRERAEEVAFGCVVQRDGCISRPRPR